MKAGFILTPGKVRLAGYLSLLKRLPDLMLES
jgi:hypothetical protein